MSRGSYSRSASWMTTISPLRRRDAGADRRALAAVALVAHQRATSRQLAAKRSTISAVPSVEPSSTTTSSVLRSSSPTRRSTSSIVARLVVGGDQEGDQGLGGHEGSAILLRDGSSGRTGSTGGRDRPRGTNRFRDRAGTLDQVPAQRREHHREGDARDRPGEQRRTGCASRKPQRSSSGQPRSGARGRSRRRRARARRSDRVAEQAPGRRRARRRATAGSTSATPISAYR